MNKNVMSKIAKLSADNVELKSEVIELAKLSDINKDYKKVLGKLSPIKSSLDGSANDLSKLIDELGEVYVNAMNLADKAKELGLGSAKEVMEVVQTAEAARNINNGLIKAFQKVKNGIKEI